MAKRRRLAESSVDAMTPERVFEPFDDGNDVNICDAESFFYAMTPERVFELFDDGDDVNICDADGLTPLFSTFSAEVTRALIECGADVNVRSNEGFTPLHSAMDAETAMELIDAGANVNARSNDGMSVLDVVQEAVPEELLEDLCNVLIAAGHSVPGMPISLQRQCARTIRLLDLDTESLPPALEEAVWDYAV